jgi:hypothetical protein
VQMGTVSVCFHPHFNTSISGRRCGTLIKEFESPPLPTQFTLIRFKHLLSILLSYTGQSVMKANVDTIHFLPKSQLIL